MSSGEPNPNVDNYNAADSHSDDDCIDDDFAEETRWFEAYVESHSFPTHKEIALQLDIVLDSLAAQSRHNDTDKDARERLQFWMSMAAGYSMNNVHGDLQRMYHFKFDRATVRETGRELHARGEMLAIRAAWYIMKVIVFDRILPKPAPNDRFSPAHAGSVAGAIMEINFDGIGQWRF